MAETFDGPGLLTARLRLRKFRPDDLKPFLDYRNDPEVARYQSWTDYSEAKAEAFVAEQAAQDIGVPGRWFQVAIERCADGRLIGDIGLHIEQDDPRLANMGYTLARDAQGQGYASEAVSAVITYAFGSLAVHRIAATTDCRNTGSVALLERLGFRREAHFREHYWFKGAWCEEYVYALLASMRPTGAGSS